MTQVQIKYLGHYSHLVTLAGTQILIDPYFGTTSEVHALNPQAIFITSALSRHLNIDSFAFLPSKIPVYCPHDLVPFIGKFIGNPINALKDNQTVNIGELKISGQSGKLWGFRTLIPRTGLSYVIESQDLRVYIGSSQAYSEHFAKQKNLKVAILPYSDCPIEKIIGHRSLNAVDVIRASSDLNADRTILIPLQSSLGGGVVPIDQLQARVISQLDAGLKEKFYFPKLGETLTFE